MTVSRRTVLLGLGFGLWAGSPPTSAQHASAWSPGHRSRVRLVAGEAEGGDRWAGIEITLDPGFKTYWRNPGESGLPPGFDWSRSENAGAIKVLWPAPSRFEEGGVAYGYEGGVVLPVRVAPRDPSQPVRLALTLDYGVCKDICIPAQADLSLDLLPGQAEAPFSALVRQARVRVPRPQPVGAEGDLSILTVAPVSGTKPRVAVGVRVPPGIGPNLFVEGPEGWFFDAPDGMIASGSATPLGSGTFLVEVDRPADAKGAVLLCLTLTAGERAIESTASLDAGQWSR